MISKRIFFSFLLAVLAGPVLGQADLQQTHIDGHVPSQEFFADLIKRDLQSFFKSGSASTVEYKLLRDLPTQSGMSFPKYYAWVKVTSGTDVIFEGAVRLAAINRVRFEITDTLSLQQVRAAPNVVGNIFPSVLVPRILEYAGAK